MRQVRAIATNEHQRTQDLGLVRHVWFTPAPGFFTPSGEQGIGLHIGIVVP